MQLSHQAGQFGSLGSVHRRIRQESAPADESPAEQVAAIDACAEAIYLPIVESHPESALELLDDGPSVAQQQFDIAVLLKDPLKEGRTVSEKLSLGVS